MRWSPPQGLAGLLVSLGVSFMSAPGRSPQGASWTPQGDEWSPSRIAATLAAWDPTRIRPARGAGPHSRALVPMALGLNGTSQALNYVGDPTGGGDFVVTGLARADTTTTLQALFFATDGTRYAWAYVASSNVVAAQFFDGSTTQTATTTLTVADGAEFSFEAGFARDGSSRYIRLTTSAGSETVTESTAGAAALGAILVFRVGFSGGDWFDGSLAEVALYRTASLDAATSAALHAGESPLLKTLPDQPSSFWPLDSERQGTDVVGGYTLSQVGIPTWTGTEVAVLRDLTGNGYHAIGWGQGMTWAGSGNARYLLGGETTASYLICAQAIAAGAPLEIALALAPDASALGYAATLANAAGSQAYGTGNINGTLGRVFAFARDAAADNVTLQDSASPAKGAWQTVNFRSPADDEQYMAVNGSQVDSGTTDVNCDAMSRLTIGAYLPGTNPFGGKIGRLSVATTLTAAERKQLTRWLARPHGIATA